MAIARLASTLAIELGGQSAGSLRSFQPASLRVDEAQQGPSPEFALRSGVRIALGEMAAEVGLGEPGPLLDWLQALLAGKLVSQDGAVLLADQNLNLRRRIGFTGGWLTALRWPLLDAAEGKQPFILGLRWLAEAVADAPASGKFKPAATTKRKALLTGNFRLLGLPFGGDAVSRVLLPAVSVLTPAERFGQDRFTRRPGTHKLGTLELGITARQADAARAWVHKLVADGEIDTSEGLSLQVEMLDASLKTVLASIALDGCLLRGLDEDVLGGSSERTAGLTLRFAVSGLALKLA
jgi:hypothetical protein